ncbi:MAG: HDIG domain-containing metalloprotein [Candidatus Omnitrophota bacterium]
MKPRVKNSDQINPLWLVAAIGLLLSAFCFLANLSLIIPLILLFLGVYLAYFKKASLRLFLNLGLLLALLIFIVHSFNQYTTFSYFYIPVAGIAMLAILLYNDIQIAFIMALISSLVTGLMIGGDFQLSLVFLVGSFMAIFSVREARTRGHLITAGLFIGGVQFLGAILLNPSIISLPPDIAFPSRVSLNHLLWLSDIWNYLKPLFFNGFICAGLAIAVSIIFESIFGVLTNFRLLELADFNQPLLKRMILEAPGTYHHSLVVSNLSEAAANAIGANALLTRVGAYYHDIGKLVKPEYFNENQIQDGDGNKHDNLEPNMSRLVILNHVKEGVELAKQYKLNQQIIDFIPQHHGTSLIFYFYQRALEDQDGQGEVKEEAFRYPGPKPQNKETAITLLADSVEGASRSLDEPTPSRIDELVRKVINNKFIDGQLDECDLTLKDLERISATFSRVLSAMHHSRVKYPEKKNGNGHHDKKSSDSNSDTP